MKLNLYKPISCKWIYLFISILLGGCLEQVNGQSLSLLANSYRDGDWLDKVQVSFNEQVVGEKYVWTIAKVKDKSLPPDSYRILNDTVCCTRRGGKNIFLSECTEYIHHRYKYNGKELDGMHGLDWCDYGARWYDGMRFLTQDPHATDYVGISPYTYCANNPINAIDIDGKDSYYTTEGIYVCDNLKETDFIYIVSDYKYLRQLSNNNWLVEFKGKQSITDADITAKAYSNIFTNVLKRKNFDTSLLENGRISVRILDSNSANSGPSYKRKDSFGASDEIPWSDAPIATEQKNADNQIKITANVVLSDSERRNYLSTVSNIENVLGVHEFLGHGVLNYTANEHWKILNMQMKHPSWKKTTKELKELYEYLKKKRPNEYLQH